jgi:hypothetical protein
MNLFIVNSHECLVDIVNEFESDIIMQVEPDTNASIPRSDNFIFSVRCNKNIYYGISNKRKINSLLNKAWKKTS